MTEIVTSVGEADAALDQLLNDELDAFNATATAGVAPARELTVRLEQAGSVVAGVSGWTWGQAPGFYQRLGYEEIFRWESVPTVGRDDVHLRTVL